MPIKDFYNTSPNDLEPGDVLVATLTLHVTPTGGFRIYRCQYPPRLGRSGMPQGMKVCTNLEEVALAIFPIALNAGLTPEI